MACLFTLNVILSIQIVNFKCSLVSFFSCMVCVFCALCKKAFTSLGGRNVFYIFFCRLEVLCFMYSSSSFSFFKNYICGHMYHFIRP